MRVPAEWEKQRSVYLCWPSHEEHWGERLADIRSFVAALIREICQYQRVDLVVQPEDDSYRDQIQGGAYECRPLEMAHNDLWIRDYGPFFVSELEGDENKVEGSLGLQQFQFNAWGEKFPPWTLDASFSQRLAEKEKLSFCSSDLILEGGAMEFNGRGVAISTLPCLVGKHRNVEAVEEVVAQIKAHLGLRDLIVLPDGLAGDHTDGHIDNMVRFVSERKVLMPDPATSKVNKEILESVLAILGEWRHPDDGWALEIEVMPSMEPLELEGELLPRSYMNFIFLNGAVFYPDYGEACGSQAQAVLGACFPDRDIVPIDCRLLIEEGGALHCMTRQRPA